MTKLNYKELINLKLSVPCSTWKKKDAVQLFVADYVDKNTDGSIEKCYYGRDTRPLFQIYFPALDATINKIELDYVFRYCTEVPPQFQAKRASFLKQETEDRTVTIQQKKKEQPETECCICFNNCPERISLTLSKRAGLPRISNSVND